MTKEEPDFLMSFKYVFKSIKFPRQSFLFFKFGRVLVRNSGSLPTLPKWGYFPEELPILQLSSWKKQSGPVPLLPYELFLNSTGISLFPYTHISRGWIFEPDFWLFHLNSCSIGKPVFWMLPLLSETLSVLHVHGSISQLSNGRGRQSWGDLITIFLTLCDQNKIKKKKKAPITETFSPVCLQHEGEAKSNLPHITPSFHFH